MKSWAQSAPAAWARSIAPAGRAGRELFFLKGDNLVSVALDGQGNVTERERVVIALCR